MKRWVIVLFILLGVVILTLILAFDVPGIHVLEPDAICLQTGSIAMPTNQQKARGSICHNGTPRQVHSQIQLLLP
jgi:hypothetical protein